MNLSITEIRRKIIETKESLTDEELFTSSSFKKYLYSILESTTGKYDSSLRLITIHDNKAEDTAFTNSETILINTGNCLTELLENRSQKVLSIIGLLAHEIGHILFTDFLLSSNYTSIIEKNRTIPLLPDEKILSETDLISLSEIKSYLNADENAAKIIFILHLINNIIEDFYVNKCICEKFTGNFKKGILLVKALIYIIHEDIRESILNKQRNITIIINLIIQYFNSNEIKNENNIKNDITDFFYDEIVSILDNAEINTVLKRFEMTNLLFIKMWKYIKEILDIYTSQEIEEIINPFYSVEPINSENRKPLIEENTELDYDDNLDSLQEDIENMESKKSEEKINSILADEFQKKLNKEAGQIDYGDIHKNIKYVENAELSIKVYSEINFVEYPEFVKEYQEYYKEISQISRNLKSVLKKKLEIKNAKKKTRGLYQGRRFDSSSTYRKDKRYFADKKFISKEIDLAVGLLIDQSGSMLGSKIEQAKKTAVIIYEFCKSLNIPIAIYGHTEWGNQYTEEFKEDDKLILEMMLFSYVDFDYAAETDKYKLMNIQALYNNRDGMALKFMCEKLQKRKEQTKLLIVISDGNPYAVCYTGIMAEEDIRNIKNFYTNKGIVIFNASIDEDKKCLERIYGSGFLDITDLDKLPICLTSLIMKYIK